MLLFSVPQSGHCSVGHGVPVPARTRAPCFHPRVSCFSCFFSRVGGDQAREALSAHVCLVPGPPTPRPNWCGGRGRGRLVPMPLSVAAAARSRLHILVQRRLLAQLRADLPPWALQPQPRPGGAPSALGRAAHSMRPPCWRIVCHLSLIFPLAP